MDQVLSSVHFDEKVCARSQSQNGDQISRIRRRASACSARTDIEDFTGIGTWHIHVDSSLCRLLAAIGIGRCHDVGRCCEGSRLYGRACSTSGPCQAGGRERIGAKGDRSSWASVGNCRRNRYGRSRKNRDTGTCLSNTSVRKYGGYGVAGRRGRLGPNTGTHRLVQSCGGSPVKRNRACCGGAQLDRIAQTDCHIRADGHIAQKWRDLNGKCVGRCTL